MSFQSIRVEGTIFSAELLSKLDDGFSGQAPKDFGLTPRDRVRERILESWGDLAEQWRIFRRRRERLAEGDPGTTDTRRFWMEPFLAALGYELELQRSGETLAGRNYPISHRDLRRAGLPVHIAGCGTSLDQKPSRGGLSPHALVQEYLNLTDRHLFALVTNGLVLRLVRDCGRISRLSYVEFDLERMFEGDLYAEFAVLWRFLHASRFSADPEDPAACVLERYHQESEAEGARIRDHLSEAVEEAIRALGNGFLSDPANGDLREAARSGALSPGDYYRELLLLVYRILFLLVIEERGLVFGPGADPEKAGIYDRFYSLRRLRRLCASVRSDLDRHGDRYRLLGETFALFDERGSGSALGIAPLGGDLFRSGALPRLALARLSNRALRDALSRLDSFPDERSGLPVRVNYASLNVEEFGSVYEGLLELEPVFTSGAGRPGFDFAAGTTRGDTGSHYTPDELVQKLVKAGVEPAVEEALAKVKARGLSGKDWTEAAEEALLSLRVLDSACGSGHMLLGAARRIGLELARVRYGEDQPSPGHLRQAVREAISRCVYGVDRNPLAVELCKVALWLEAHEPGKPLGFLDHRIKCGDSLAGAGRFEDLEAGIPDEAFKAKPGDDKKAASALAKRNAKEREEARVRQALLDFGMDWASSSRALAARGYARVDRAGDEDLAQAEAKRRLYEECAQSPEARALRVLADIRTAQFFLPILEGQGGTATTEGAFRACLRGEGHPEDLPGYPGARAQAERRRFFHWFAEFPTVFEGKDGGFDVILGNPPFLGGRKLSGTLGDEYLAWLKAAWPPAGAIDLVGFFFRRNYDLLAPGGRMALIATKTLAEGDTREGSLDVIARTGTIYWAYKSIPWPGKAAVSVSLAAVRRGPVPGPYFLNGKKAETISPYLDDARTVGNPYRLAENAGKSFQGSIVLGSGFVLSPGEAAALIARNPKNKDVIFPYLNGEDLNSRPDGSPSRWVIQMDERTEEQARGYPEIWRILEERVKPERMTKDANKYPRMVNEWWKFWNNRQELARAITGMERVMGISRVTKYLSPSFVSSNIVASEQIVILSMENLCEMTLVTSNIFDGWTWSYSSKMEGRLRFSPSDCFETFPFPECLRSVAPKNELDASLRAGLEDIGKEYYDQRAALMRDLNLGLTKTYNLFHDPDLDRDTVAAALAKSGGAGDPEDCLARIRNLRDLHARMDRAVLKAYSWPDLDPDHGFHELDFLPENDRVRFTIGPAARREVLERLLELNWRRHREEGGE